MSNLILEHCGCRCKAECHTHSRRHTRASIPRKQFRCCACTPSITAYCRPSPGLQGDAARGQAQGYCRSAGVCYLNYVPRLKRTGRLAGSPGPYSGSQREPYKGGESSSHLGKRGWFSVRPNEKKKVQDPGVSAAPKNGNIGAVQWKAEPGHLGLQKLQFRKGSLAKKTCRIWQRPGGHSWKMKMDGSDSCTVRFSAGSEEWDG